MIDNFVNLSDHLPVSLRCMCNVSICHEDDFTGTNNTDNLSVYSLRWDYADLSAYKQLTGCYLPHMLYELYDLEKNSWINTDTIEWLYQRLVGILSYCSEKTIPLHKKNFFNFFGGTKNLAH